MKAVLQRADKASVSVCGNTVGSTNDEGGLLILLGVENGDGKSDAEVLAEKISKLRIFCDNEGKMNLSPKDLNKSALVISNFTLCADYSHGNRPSYFDAMAPKEAQELYEYFCAALRNCGVPAECGVFGADMKISASLDGPVTIIMDSRILKDGKKH